ncbi:uncharacterized protein ISCGN_026443 [Ixodes scapularis]
MICNASDFGECIVSVYEQWESYIPINQLQKALVCSTPVGRGTGMATAVPFTLIVLLSQVSGFSGQRQCFDGCETCSLFAPRIINGINEIKTSDGTDLPRDDADWMICNASDFGECIVSVYEQWESYLPINQLQKALVCSTPVGRGTGMATAVPFTLIVLLSQVSDAELSPLFSVYVLPVPPQTLFACLSRYSEPERRSRRCFRLLRRFAFYFLLLLLCGDIELNPGPTTAEQLQQLLDGQATIQVKLASIETTQVENKVAIDDLVNRMTSLESKLNRLDQLHTAIKECKTECENQRREFGALMARVDDLENRSRRCNLIFYGVPDAEARESNAVSEKRISEICESRLGLAAVVMERAHRLGKFQNGKNRALIAKFTSFKEKKLILRNARKLKGTPFSISEDFSQVVRSTRKRLWDFAKSRRKDGDKVNLRYDTLLLNGTKYVYDDETNQVVPHR